MEEALSREAILGALNTCTLGRSLEVHVEIDSTSARAVSLAREGAPHGMVVLADRQTAGRGRLGRTWYAPGGSSLLLSVILRPELEPAQAQRMTMICSLAATEAIASVSGVTSKIKWPNDLVVAGRKLGGVLTELGLTASRLEYVVVGMGINVNLELEALPEVMSPPTSLLAETGRPVSRLALLAELLQGVERRLSRMRSGWSPHTEWRRSLATLGEQVDVGTPDEIVTGMAVDVDADGALLVEMASGKVQRILVGDVTLRGHRVGPSSG